jgi:hypothetical protein
LLLCQAQRRHSAGVPDTALRGEEEHPQILMRPLRSLRDI